MVDFLQSKDEAFLKCLQLNAVLIKHGNLNLWEKYGTDTNYGEFGLSVARKYRGRKVGEHLLKARYV